ncbi:MAG: MTAP family purine nucleoside phosphorylase [Bdellovibrionaceae bacterium]|nr:MTAP family purine nucleoside phosphorylase [Bdellovibrionales bacterium]MCB9086585.1 MTAP family purine nucleoside phosphorylase [Pseudobdellovibrionaceae bacterium]
MWAIIGGSGFEKFDGFKAIGDVDRETPFGLASSGIKRVQLGSHECLFVSRHGSHHELLPSEVNFRANIFALKRAGAKAIVSFSAIGSLRQEYKPGDMVIPVQYMDRTKGVRAHTFCGDGIVGHVSLAKPICQSMANKAMELTNGVSFDRHIGQTYVCIEGPFFSTKAESNWYRSMGADIIGMTHCPEVGLAREAGLPYLPCCFVTDYDCWDDSIPHVTLEEVIQTMRQNNSKAFEVAEKVLASGSSLYEGCDCAEQGLRMGLMTPKEAIPSDKMQWLEVLL